MVKIPAKKASEHEAEDADEFELIDVKLQENQVAPTGLPWMQRIAIPALKESVDSEGFK